MIGNARADDWECRDLGRDEADDGGGRGRHARAEGGGADTVIVNGPEEL